MSRITFLVQNETHALNFEPIIHALLDHGIQEEMLQTLHLDPVFGMETADRIFVPNQRTIDLPIPKPYYHLSRVRRFRWLLEWRYAIEEHVTNTRLIVIGSDGALQRVAANAVQSRGGNAIMLLDGLLHPWPQQWQYRVRYIIKRAINRIVARWNLNYLTPADVGHSNLSRIMVMNETVKHILRNQGVKAPIDVVNLPRFDDYTADFQRLRSGTKPKCHLLYATGSYLWHGLHVEHQYQKKDLRDLRRFALHNSDWTVRIRIHPREESSRYRAQEWPENVELSGPEYTVLEDLAWSSVLVTARSTMAVEAEIVGLPVLIYTRNFGNPEKTSYFNTNPYFCVDTNLVTATTLARRVRNESDYQSSVRTISATLLDHFHDDSV